MPCFKPLQAWHKLGGGITFSPTGSNSIPCKLPCGQCIGCRIERKQEWALRLVHESKLHERSAFVTLTYDPEFLPRGGTLVKRHVQLFIKRLRKSLKVRKIRFFACGEYGPQSDRPHYHLIIFGWEPSDGKLHSDKGRYRVYTSDALSALWPYGFHTWSHTSPENCAYVGNYTVKKITGQRAKDHYTRITTDGEMIEIQPEFALMSTRPGIGHDFYREYESDFRNSDAALLLGRRKRVPRYYDKLLQRESEQQLEAVKEKRKNKARKHRANNTPERLAARETVLNAKLKTFQREQL